MIRQPSPYLYHVTQSYQLPSLKSVASSPTPDSVTLSLP